MSSWFPTEAQRPTPPTQRRYPVTETPCSQSLALLNSVENQCRCIPLSHFDSLPYTASDASPDPPFIGPRSSVGQVYSKLAIVDLAGSERALKTKAQVSRWMPSPFFLVPST